MERFCLHRHNNHTDEQAHNQQVAAVHLAPSYVCQSRFGVHEAA